MAQLHTHLMGRGPAGGLWQAGCALQRQLLSRFEAVDSCSRQSCSHGWPRGCFWPLQMYPNRPAHLAPAARRAPMELLAAQIPAHRGRSRGFGEGPCSGLWLCLSLLRTYLFYFVLLTCHCVCIGAVGRKRDGDSDSRLKCECPMTNT